LKPELGRLKPPQLTLETVLGKDLRCSARLLAKTSRYDFRTGNPQRTLLLFATSYGNRKYRFLIGVDPAAAAPLAGLGYGDRILLKKVDGELRANDVPIRRFYRKTIEGVVEMADSAIRHLRRRQP